MSRFDELLINAEAYAEGLEVGERPSAPARKIAVVTCMDARIDPARLLGLDEGDAHVIRNAGGLVTDDALRSLSISQRKLGTEEIAVIQHTGCGLLTFTDEEFATELAAEVGERPEWNAGTFPDLDQSVRDGVARIRSSPFVPRTDCVRGFVLEIETGALREVE
jgi:carbonic anhydrase